MNKKVFSFRITLVALLAAGLACNTLTGGGVSQDNLELTAQAAKDSAQATADAALNQLEATPEPSDNGNQSGDENGNTDNGNDSSGVPGFTDGPEDVPVMEGNVENYFGTEELLSYTIDTDLDTVVAFYKDEMPANGWEYNEAGSIETTDAVILNYSKSDKLAVVTIGKDATTNNTVVLVTLSPG